MRGIFDRIFWARGLGEQMPIYTTRKSAHGETMSYSLSLWMTLLAIALVWFNVIVWGVIGIYLAIRMVA